MTPFLAASGTVFGLVAMAHVARIMVEPHLAREPWFLVTTAIAAGLSVWAWALLLRSRRT